MATIGAIEEFLNRRYPEASAQSWDRVGLVTGERDQQVDDVLLTVDVTDAVIDEAARAGAGLIIAHHPLLLRGIHAVDPSDPKGRMLTKLIRSGIGLLTAHTNADVPSGGVADALASVLGLSDIRALAPAVPGLDKIVAYVPTDHTENVIAALADAGAGATDGYDRCAYQVEGTGRFRPLPGSDPYLGSPGEVTQVKENRVEMILERAHRDRVRAALLASHPYEEPAFDITEIAAPPPGSQQTSSQPADVPGLGRLGTITRMRLTDFADQVGKALPTTAGGIRVAGDPQRMVSLVALQAGAGDDLLATARRAGADVYLTSDLRHHPATEAIAWQDAPALIDVSHWAAEWTWLPVLKDQLQEAFNAEQPDLSITVCRLRTDAWSWTVGAETR
jgi:dinuclear metal center YbgI/SA1388 family protein